MVAVILMGIGVMMSMVLWKIDEANAKRLGTFTVPVATQLVYPLRDFMDGIYFLRDHTSNNSVVLSYVTTSNFIGAYAGNFSYIGHANTPDENEKEAIAARFFKGEMGSGEAIDFLKGNRISYVYFGPQERELGWVGELSDKYQFLNRIYSKGSVVIYEFSY